tara:strand:- start:366 stop:686 length:321 start_codon:yes stop_codon:yes gene_type:complete
MTDTKATAPTKLQILHSYTLGKYPLIDANAKLPEDDAAEIIFKAVSGAYNANLIVRLEGDNLVTPVWNLEVLPFVEGAARKALAELALKVTLLGQFESAREIMQSQ